MIYEPFSQLLAKIRIISGVSLDKFAIFISIILLYNVWDSI